ncbi:MAG: hypothetical protein DWP97_04435 [Calditrichaeota bacterium]|nr:MAG: hypothetical protein DWP97_04435 [Calditrichota bacterium]
MRKISQMWTKKNDIFISSYLTNYIPQKEYQYCLVYFLYSVKILYDLEITRGFWKKMGKSVHKSIQKSMFLAERFHPVIMTIIMIRLLIV